MELYPDFFNDVFGPIMQPGSSSHTAGPCRIGYLAHSLLKASLKKICIILDPQGSFAGTFGLMSEDLGMLAGAYGLLPDDERIFHIREILKEEEISFEFRYEKIEASSHLNAVKFILTDVNGKTVSLVGNSTGGGMIEIVQIMDQDFYSRGDKEETLIYGDEKYKIPAILPVTTTEDKKPQLFQDFRTWIQLSKEQKKELWETAIDYEKAASGWNESQIIDYMKKIQTIMERETDAVNDHDENLIECDSSGYHFRKWGNYCRNSNPISGAVIAKVLRYTYHVQAMRKGVKMVPGPMGTGGGFLYAVIRTIKEEYHLTEEDVLHGLFVAAGVGVICYTRTNPTGEIVGCAGECGVCAAMASAAVTQMLGGTPEEVEHAASLSLQMAIGWPCDPIPGGMNQPCFSRFSTAVVMAIVFADLALSGRDSVLPFHEVVDVMDKVGRNMPNEYKCTALGGMCDAPTARRCRNRKKN